MPSIQQRRAAEAKLRRGETSYCLCGNVATLFKWGSWVCERCHRIENMGLYPVGEFSRQAESNPNWERAEY